jgi:hypothetical protein
MTRLANIEKAGYFPLPPAVTDLIASHIDAPRNGRLLDPCAGEGEALVSLAEALGLIPYGVELHEGRAQTARAAVEEFLEEQERPSPTLTHILHDSYLNLIAPHNSFNLLYLNSPYDHDDEDSRLEYQWLTRSRPWLQPGGLLIWVVPQHLLKLRKAARYLAGWYEQITVYRFPDLPRPDGGGSLYEQFHQIVLFGRRRAKSVPPDEETVAQLIGMAAGKEALTPLTAAPSPVYRLPALIVPDGRFHFRSFFIDPAEALAEAARCGAAGGSEWRLHLDPEGQQAPLRPLTPLKMGHMHSIIAAGHLNNQVLAGEPDGDQPGQRLLIKGRSYKVPRSDRYQEELADGRIRVTNLETETVVTDITTIDSEGLVKDYKGPALEQFLKGWLTHLTGIVARTYTPVYQFDLNGYGGLLNRLSKERPIPGLNGKSGLLPAQKHAAAAVLTRLETAREAIVVGEMGTGKSSLAAAVAAGRQARRTIVLCPPHLVDKWQREFQAVWPQVRTTHLQTIRDVDQFFGPQPDNKPLVGVLKQTSARSASGWVHAYDYNGPASHNYGSKGYSDVERLWGSVLQAGDLKELSVEERTAACRRRLTPRQIAAMQVRGIRCPVCGEPVMMSGRPILFQEMKTATRHCTNAACGSPLYQFSRRRSESQERGSFKQYAQRERAIRAALASGRTASFSLTSPPPRADQGYAKVPLAGYIKKRGKGKLDLVIIDEVHQYKGIDSDQGYAMHHLAQAARKVVALTGTIYGGKASSLFYLLFRLAPEMAHQYVNPDASGQRRLLSREWVSAYGILQQIETITLDEDGRQTANSRSNIRYKELPGGSPAMLPWLLNRSVFLSLGDMGFPLPPYNEIPVSVPMHPVQADYYESLKQQLQAELKERLVRGDKSLLAGYLFALLFWPDSPRRAKVVRCPRTERVVASVPALPEAFIGPKEEEIIDLCLQEKAQGRRVLLLCQQTDTLDIQPEWKRMLEAAGLKAAILRAAPNKREGWVEKQVKAGVDVIITHPRKVETGIDLLDFPTIVWMAIDYSVYTVLQGSRRSWRIGQTEPVKVYHFAYEGTIQEDALRLVAAKVAATLRINGDTVGNDSLADLDELSSGDLVTTLARIVVGQSPNGETELEAHSLQQAFAEANADLRQANVLIGDYTIVDEDEDVVEVEPDANGRLPQPLPLPVNDLPTNGHAWQESLLNQSLGNGRNGKDQVDHPEHHVNGKRDADHGEQHGNGRSQTNKGDLNGRTTQPAAPTTPAEPDDKAGQPPAAPTPPPVPRPRLVF